MVAEESTASLARDGVSHDNDNMAKELREDIAGAWEEFRNGVAITTEFVMAIGQRPS